MIHGNLRLNNMNTQKAIIVCNNHLHWSKTGNHVKYEELNTELFQLALQHLITLAHSIDNEGNGLADK